MIIEDTSFEEYDPLVFNFIITRVMYGGFIVLDAKQRKVDTISLIDKNKIDPIRLVSKNKIGTAALVNKFRVDDIDYVC